jgi:hypothetical protein
MGFHQSLPIHDQLRRMSIALKRKSTRVRPGHDITDLLVLVAQMARDPQKASPEALRAARVALEWAGQAKIKSGSVAEAAMAEIRRLVRETPHLRG